MKPLQGFWRGFGFLLSGLELLRNTPSLRKWVLIPFLIDFGLFLLGIYWGISIIPAWTQAMMTWLFPDPVNIFVQILQYIPLILFWIAFIVLWSFLICLLAGIIASPFNSILAEKSLSAMNLIDDQDFHLRRWLKTSFHMLLSSILKTGLFLFLGLFIFLMSFVPVLNFVSSYLALIILSFDCLDYSFESYGMNLRQRFLFARQASPELIGMASSLAITLLVPGLILLIMPLAVIGAASLFKYKSINGRREFDSRHYSSQNN